jgi:hypothetical protein
LRRLRQFFVLSSLTFPSIADPIGPSSMRLARTLQLLLLMLVLVAAGGCEKKTDSVVNSVGRPPVLLQTDISPSSINSDSINVGGSRNPDDLLSLSTIISARVVASPDNPIWYVRFSLKNPLYNQTISEGELLDTGGGADQTKGDSLFTGKATFQIKRVEIGVFRVEVHAEAQNGFQSNTAVAPLTVYRGNHLPTLSSLDAPDTLKLANQTQLLPLRIRAAVGHCTGHLQFVQTRRISFERKPVSDVRRWCSKSWRSRCWGWHL